jgi:hypothetical protein
MHESTTRHGGSRPYVPEDVKHHLHAARAEMRKGLETILPHDFFTHRDAARREMLLAWRGVLDAAIQHLDERRQERGRPMT